MAVHPSTVKQAGDVARELVAAMERERRADEALAAAQESKKKAVRDVEVFVGKMREIYRMLPDHQLFLVGQKIVQKHPHSGDVLVVDPAVVDEGRR